MPDFDFIVVGAGAAGCVLASRLTEDPATRLMLIEAGADQPPGQEHPSIRDPYPVSLGDPAFSWPDLTAEVGADLGGGEPRLSRHYLQGLGVGGGSNIQGMVAFRGYPQDYDAWREAGAAGWGWQDVLPYFRRLERDLDFGGPLHGQEGPIPIRRIAPEEWAPFSRAFAESAQAMGYPLVRDLNADFRAAVGPLPMANLPKQRVSAAHGYLDATVRGRPNLTLAARALVERVDVRSGRAAAVTVRMPGGRQSVSAREIILSAGALHSPAILMRSGIGPAGHLRQHGIEVVADVPAVGQHLTNHVGLSIAVHLPRHAAQPATQRGFGQSCLRLSSGVEGAENDLVVVPINRSAWHALGRRIGAIAVEVHKTHSQGEVRLRSADPATSPEVRFNLLSDPRDLARLLFGFAVCLKISAHPRMAAVGHEWFLPNRALVQSLWEPGLVNSLKASLICVAFEASVIRRSLIRRSRIDPRALLADPLALRQLALERAGPPHHVSCTCRMGSADDAASVVDPDCRVRRIGGLRVIDASIMPSLVRANTHIPVLMIAERMAERIRAARS